MKKLRVYTISLGCPKNRVDTEHVLGSLPLPIEATPHMGRAHMIFVNTCGFILPAIEESVKTLVDIVHHISGLKKRPLLVVAGCLVSRFGSKDLAQDLPEVDVWLPNATMDTWPHEVTKALGLESQLVVPGRLLSTPKSYAWLKVSDGCRHACSFCTIPSIRGKHRSVPAATLVEEAKNVLSQGVKELVLVAQDVSSWGEDLSKDGEQNLRTLVEQLLPLQGLKWLRLMYLYPSGLTENTLAFMKEASDGGPLLPYFDIPMQHAHEDILQRMGRPFARDPRKVVDRVRSFMPHAALRTSFIVGFPGEEEEHFASLRDFVMETRLHHVGVFAYEAEEGTRAAVMDGQVDAEVKEERKAQIMGIQADISAEILEQEVGKDQSVLVDSEHEEWPGLHAGRVWFQAPEVDGITYISGPGVSVGNMVTANIVESSEYDLTALT